MCKIEEKTTKSGMLKYIKQCMCSRFYQWYTNIVQGSTNGTIGNTIGTNGNANGTIGSPDGTIGKPMVPSATNGTIGRPRTESVLPE